MFLTADNNIKWKKMGLGALVCALLVLAGVLVFDKPLFLFLREFDCGVWNILDLVFSAKVWIAVSGIAVIIFCAKKCATTDCDFLRVWNKKNIFVCIRDLFNKIRTNNAFLIFSSVLGAGVVVKILKTLIGRARPIFFEALDMTGFFPPSLDWAFNSMPSGHTAVSFAGLVMIGMLAPRYKVLTWSMAIIVAVSRVAIGAHWPSDVVLGAFIGMVVADIVKGMLLRKK